MPPQTYVGSELDVFATAIGWKKYYGQFLQPYLHGHVLEVGAGIGGTTAILCDGTQEVWMCLEPDERMAAQIRKKIEHKELPQCCRAVAGDLRNLPASMQFHAILYVDVLEHIFDDRAELARAAVHLLPGSVLIVVAPAHQWLFSSFDQAVGHYRRYTKNTLRSLTPDLLKIVKVFYLDAMGLLLSLGNRVLLRQSHPSRAQIDLWSRRMIPISRRVDSFLGYAIGKSLVGIWERTG